MQPKAWTEISREDEGSEMLIKYLKKGKIIREIMPDRKMPEKVEIPPELDKKEESVQPIVTDTPKSSKKEVVAVEPKEEAPPAKEQSEVPDEEEKKSSDNKPVRGRKKTGS